MFVPNVISTFPLKSRHVYNLMFSEVFSNSPKLVDIFFYISTLLIYLEIRINTISKYLEQSKHVWYF